jgi:hypothetical protein
MLSSATAVVYQHSIQYTSPSYVAPRLLYRTVHEASRPLALALGAPSDTPPSQQSTIQYALGVPLSVRVCHYNKPTVLKYLPTDPSLKVIKHKHAFQHEGESKASIDRIQGPGASVTSGTGTVRAVGVSLAPYTGTASPNATKLT